MSLGTRSRERWEEIAVVAVATVGELQLFTIRGSSKSFDTIPFLEMDILIVIIHAQ